MNVVCFTSINAAYLPNARILARSVRAHHPDWTFVLLMSDASPPEVNWSREPFDHIVFSDGIGIDGFRRWAFQYSIVELCTAVKGRAAEHFFDNLNADRVIYLDPDTKVFSPLEELDDYLERSSFLLTPHLTDPETGEEGIESHEIASLKHGTFNLGFFCVSNDLAGRIALAWWAKRLLHYAMIDFQRGIFTDQKWANLMPYMFDGVGVIRDRTYNVATWNMRGRTLDFNEQRQQTVNGQPLRFYHFSGFGNGFAWADQELRMFAANPELIGLWNDYKDEYLSSKSGIENYKWAWGHFENGEPITGVHRKTYGTHCGELAGISDPYSVEMYEKLESISA